VREFLDELNRERGVTILLQIAEPDIEEIVRRIYSTRRSG
jgi:hypothetical protein